ncbi:MAG: hypothetical protein ACTSU2_07050 [Promethearchaeota archaeon]
MIFIAVWQFTTLEMIVQILYGALLMFLLIFGFELLGRYMKADKKTRNDAAYMIFLVISIALIGYAVYLVPAIVNYFYPPRRAWTVAVQQSMVLAILIPFGLVTEKILWRRKSKFSYFGILAGALLIYCLFIFIVEIVKPDMINDTNSLQYYLPIFIGDAIFGLTGFLGIILILFYKLKPLKDIKNKILLALIWGIIALIASSIGGIFRKPPPQNDNWLYLVARLVNLFSWLMFRHYMLSVPSYSEIEWRDGLIELHVIQAEMGLSLYYYKFNTYKDLKGDLEVTMKIKEEDMPRPNSDLIGGGVVGIKGLLGEIAGEKGKLEHIKIGEKSLVFKSGKAIMCLLLCKKNLGVYHALLSDLVKEIEETYPDLINFNGNLENIKIEPIVKKIFELKN